MKNVYAHVLSSYFKILSKTTFHCFKITMMSCNEAGQLTPNSSYTSSINVYI